jgi:thiol-disulfide isomerase/thioredoxin
VINSSRLDFMRVFSHFTFLFLLISSGAAFAQTNLTTKLIEKDGRKILYGAITAEQVYFDFPVWKQIADGYTPAVETVKALKAFKKQSEKVEVMVFLGTWCPDSRRNVPIFLKCLESAELKPITKILATDVYKKLESGLEAKHKVTRVPTFVFLKEGKEIGRITEYPTELMEVDIFNIFKSMNAK